MIQKTIFFTVVLMLCVSIAFCAAFTPTPLRLSAPQNISYEFDGKTLVIPVTVSGAPANVIFLVYTKDKAEGISKVKNGFLGWHYVNKVDTCLYHSPPQQMGKGTGSIFWNGKDQDGNLVPAGECTYYLWGYDDQTPRVKALNWTTPGAGTVIFEKDEDGKPLANPLFTTNNSKWALGSDPEDNSLRETTALPSVTGWTIKGRSAFKLNDFKTLYAPVFNLDSKTGGLWKINWVPQGKAIRDEQFDITWNQLTQFEMSAITNGEYAFVNENNYKETEVKAPIHVVDIEAGEHLGIIDLSEWWGSLSDYQAGGQMNGGPNYSCMRDGKIFYSGKCSCIRMLMDPMAFFDKVEETVIWVNGNGDYVLDLNFDPNSTKKWVCHDFNTGPYTYNVYADANLFSFYPAYDMGAVSFGLLAPDGTGIGYFAFAGETANTKSGILACDNDSAFDGMYSSRNEVAENKLMTGTWFIGHDTIKGIIGTQIKVKDSPPSLFSVAQNTPNPFNPSTTITFTLSKPGKTTVDVFNAAGQKVDTILSANLSAGSHSTTWNASKHSAGIYFYTVRCGEFSKTMKMTLLK